MQVLLTVMHKLRIYNAASRMCNVAAGHLWKRESEVHPEPPIGRISRLQHEVKSDVGNVDPSPALSSAYIAAWKSHLYNHSSARVITLMNIYLKGAPIPPCMRDILSLLGNHLPQPSLTPLTWRSPRRLSLTIGLLSAQYMTSAQSTGNIS